MWFKDKSRYSKYQQAFTLSRRVEYRFLRSSVIRFSLLLRSSEKSCCLVTAFVSPVSDHQVQPRYRPTLYQGTRALCSAWLIRRAETLEPKNASTNWAKTGTNLHVPRHRLYDQPRYSICEKSSHQTGQSCASHSIGSERSNWDVQFICSGSDSGY